MSKSSLARAVVCGAAATMLGALPCGCKRSAQPTPAGSAAAAASAASSAIPAAEASRCRRLPGYSLTLEASPVAAGRGRPVAGEAQEDDDDDEALLPFGVDMGTAVATTYGFAAAGLRGAGQAFVALLAERASHHIDLGELHGDAETPALAATGERVIVALRSSDAAGFTVKLGQVVGPEGALEWGYELSKLGKELTGLTLAAAGERGLLAYQGIEKGSPRLFMAGFATAALKDPIEVKALEVKDAETPRLAIRPGGYWLAWVRTLPEAKKPQKPAVDAGNEDPEERDLLDVGLRVVEVAKLDERGERQGAVLRVGEPRRQVLLFDMAPAAAGSLLVAMRSDSAAPGAEGGAMLLSEIGADGSVHEERLEDDELGVGAPMLLVDAKLPEPWLAVSSASDATRLGRARGQRTVLEADPLLGRAEVLAVGAGHFLTQRSRGRGVELAALDCQLERPVSAEQK
jgi:hypothetical protein